MNESILYPYALFLHVLGAMALVAFYGIEWVVLARLRQVSTAKRALEALAPFGAGRMLISLSMPAILLSGLYMTWAAWGWIAPWIVTGFAAMLLLGALGGAVTGKHVRGLMASQGADLHVRLPSMWSSFVIRVTVLSGVIFLMCAKPGLVGSIVAMAISLAAGKLLAGRSTRTAVAPTT